MKIKPFPMTLPSAVDEYTLGNLAAQGVVLEQLIDLFARSFSPLAEELTKLRQRLHEGQDFSHEFSAIRFLTDDIKSDGELSELETFKMFADDQPNRQSFTNWMYRSGLLLSHPSLTPALSLPRSVLVNHLPVTEWDNELPYYEAFSRVIEVAAGAAVLVKGSLLLTRSNEVEDFVLIPLSKENLYLAYALDRMEWCLVASQTERKLLVVSHYIAGFYNDVENLKRDVEDAYVNTLSDDAKKYFAEDESAAATIEVMAGKMFELARQMENQMAPVSITDGSIVNGRLQLGSMEQIGTFFSFGTQQGEVLFVQSDLKRMFFVAQQKGTNQSVLIPVTLEDLSRVSVNILLTVVKQGTAALKAQIKARDEAGIVAPPTEGSPVESPADEAKRVSEARSKTTKPAGRHRK